MSPSYSLINYPSHIGIHYEYIILGCHPDELLRVYRRVKLSEDEPYGREEEDITLFA